MVEECRICFENWDSDNCVPKVLPCGHSFCDPCIRKILEIDPLGRGGVKCPTCQTVHMY